MPYPKEIGVLYIRKKFMKKLEENQILDLVFNLKIKLETKSYEVNIFWQISGDL